MKIVVVVDSFKESLSSLEAGMAICKGILSVYPEAHIDTRPLADGGEGTLEALTLGLSGRLEKILVTGPLGKKVEAAYGILPYGVVVVEMAQAAGLGLISHEEKNPYCATTFGVGEILSHAMKKGYRRFIIGIGGSATNDGGVGMLMALGFKFLTKEGDEISLGVEGLKDLYEIKTDNVLPELAKSTFRVACDVKNPLCGSNGCSAVYGPQKGATSENIAQMDKWLLNYAMLTQKIFPNADPNFPGTGAAGGLGFAFLAYTNAKLESGVKIVLEETKLENYIKEADLIITGEGRLDAQTIMGKAPIGVARLAKKYNKPVLAFAGSVTRDANELNSCGIDAFFPIMRSVSTLEEALAKENARQNMRDTVEQVMRLIRANVKF